MPCRSDYLEPTNSEKDTKQAAKLLKYVLDSEISLKLRDKCTVPYNVLEQIYVADYPNIQYLNILVKNLCAIISGMNELQLNSIVYDGRIKTARELADWWEIHQIADKERKQKEADELLKKSALKKLTKEEKRVLGL